MAIGIKLGEWRRVGRLDEPGLALRGRVIDPALAPPVWRRQVSCPS